MLLPVLAHSPPRFDPSLNPFCSLIYVVASMSGYRALTINEVFPHSVHLLRPLIDIATTAPSLGWESQYVVYLWLSVVVMAPFELQAMGFNTASSNDQIYDICISGIRNGPNPAVKKAASVLLARFLCRKDNPLLSRFLSDSPDIVALNQILKIVPVARVLDELWEFTETTPPSVSKYFLRVISSITVLQIQNNPNDPNSVLDQVESAINKILNLGCQHPSIVIRESVAKAIGRIAACLPKEYTEQLLKYLLAGINVAKIDFEFHSILLIFGEICRRKNGLLFFENPNSDLIKIIADGIETERHIATPIRDSACALVWSIARAVGGNGLGCNLISAGLFSRIVPSLLTLALFDKDINMRRTGAAALQELIGRVGTALFPCGLKILDIVDFWSVSELRGCYTEIPVQLIHMLEDENDEIICSKNLLEIFQSHLWSQRIFYDNSKKIDWVFLELASHAFSKLLCFRSTEFISKTICQISEKLFSDSPDIKTVRVGCMCLLNSIVSDHGSYIASLGEDAKSVLRNVVPQLEKRRLFKEKYGEKLRIYSYKFLSKIFSFFSFLGFKNAEKFLEKIVSIIHDGVINLLPVVSSAAVHGLAALSFSHPNVPEPLIHKYVNQLEVDTDMNLCARRGMLMALLSVNRSILPMTAATNICLKEAVSWPVHFSKNRELVDPECRRLAVLFLGKYFSDNISSTIFSCLEDFQTDKRGDVGSWVREAALDVLRYHNFHDAIPVLSHGFERLDKVRDIVFSPIREWNAIAAKYAIVESSGHSETVSRKMGVPNYTSHSNLLRSLLVGRQVSDIELEQIMSQIVVCIGSTTPCTITTSMERNLVDICESYAEVFDRIISTLSKFIIEMKFFGSRFSGRIDAIHRLWIPSINTFSLLMLAIPRARPVGSMDSLVDSIMSRMDQFCLPSITAVIAMKSISKFLTSIICCDSKKVFQTYLSQVLSSDIPVVRVAGAADLVKWILCNNIPGEELLEIIESTSWSAEESNEWRNSVKRIANILNVDLNEDDLPQRRMIESKKIEPSKFKDMSGYAQFIHEEYRLS